VSYPWELSAEILGCKFAYATNGTEVIDRDRLLCRPGTGPTAILLTI
jgi:hypothetical protein